MLAQRVLGKIKPTMGTALLSARVGGRPNVAPSKRYLSFSFAGPRGLNEIIKKELLENKTGTEIADIWYTYHETRVRNGQNGSSSAVYTS